MDPPSTQQTNDDIKNNDIELQQLDSNEHDDDDDETQQLLNSLQSLATDDSYTGRMDKEDLRKMFQQNKLQTDLVDIVFDTIDSDQDTYINMSEYQYWSSQLDLSSLQKLLQKRDEAEYRTEEAHPPDYIGQGSLAIDDLPETEDRDLLMKNPSNTKTSKEIGDIESTTPPSTARMGTTDTQVSDVSNATFPSSKPPKNMALPKPTATENLSQSTSSRTSAKLKSLSAITEDSEKAKSSTTTQQQKQSKEPDKIAVPRQEEEEEEKDNAFTLTNISKRISKTAPRSPQEMDPFLNQQDTGHSLFNYNEMEPITVKEYACKRCTRPVRNNVFMEKTVDECEPEEVEYEVQRLVCCFHFLIEEFDIFSSLKGYLKSIENESKIDNISSPYAFVNVEDMDDDLDQAHHHHAYHSTLRSGGYVIVSQPSMKRSDMALHIRWLHMAYVTERNERVSQRKLGGNTVTKTPPKFGHVIQKSRPMAQMYEYLKAVFRDTIYALTEAFMRLNADKYDMKPDADFDRPDGHEEQKNNRQSMLIDDLKKTLKLRQLGDIAGDEARASVNLGVDDQAGGLIKKLTTFNSDALSDDLLTEYQENRKKYDPVYSCTPTENEMECYLSLCQVLFSDSISSHNLASIGIGNFQKIKEAFTMLRSHDPAIAQKVNGWVTTIDNILCVLLYRDLKSYRKNFIGELQLSMVIEGNQSTQLETYENRNVLTVIKESIVYAYEGLPRNQDAVDNTFAAEDIILRSKVEERAHICACGTCKMCDGNHLVRLTFGIQCDDAKFNLGNNNNYKISRKFPYKFLYQSKRLFEQVYRNKFGKLFDSYVRKKRAQFKLSEIHTYDLSTFEYPKSDIDIQLTQQFAESAYNGGPNASLTFVGSSDANNVGMIDKTKLQNYESSRSNFDILAPDFNTLGATNTMRGGLNIRRQQTVEQYFVHSFETENLVEFADTILEEDYGVMFETRVVNWLNRLLNVYNPVLTYSRLTRAEIVHKLAETGKMEDLYDDGKANTHLDISTVPTTMDDMNRNISTQSTASYSALLPEKERTRKGHKLCCGLCYLTFSMVWFALVMSVIVAIGGWNVWKIAEMPMEPTMKDILSFTEKMISAETEYVWKRALFSTEQFIDFSRVLPFVTHSMDNTQLFEKFLDNELISQPRFDGIFQIKPGLENETVIANYIFKKRNNSQVDYNCSLSDVDSCVHRDLFMISNNMWDVRDIDPSQEHTDTFFISDGLIDGKEYSDTASIWFITWRYIDPAFNTPPMSAPSDTLPAFIIGGMFRSSRINEEYQKLTLAKQGVIYWVTNDAHRDVFVTSLKEEVLYISEHSDLDSSISLDSSFGFAKSDDYDDEAVHALIVDTVGELDGIPEGEQTLTLDEKYFVYKQFENATFGNFSVVIAFPKSTVFEKLDEGLSLTFAITSVAILFAIINACIANAVPLIPATDSWLRTPYFTEQDKKQLNDNIDFGMQIHKLHAVADSQQDVDDQRQRRENVESPHGGGGQPPPAKLFKTATKTKLGLGPQFKKMEVQEMDIPLAPIKDSSKNVIPKTSVSSRHSNATDVADRERRKANRVGTMVEDEMAHSLHSPSLAAEAIERQRSNSDVLLTKKDTKRLLQKQLSSKEDAIMKLQALSDEMVNKSKKSSVDSKTGPQTVGLKKPKADLPHADTDFGGMSKKRRHKTTGAVDREGSLILNTETWNSMADEDDEKDALEGPPGFNFKRAVSVATGLGKRPNANNEFLRKRRETELKKRKEAERRLKLWKKKQQKLQLEKNINYANMRSLFSRTETSYKTKYAQRMNTAINLVCALTAVLVIVAYLVLRNVTERDIVDVMEAHLMSSNQIVENHAEFKVYQHGLALQQGQLLLNSYSNNSINSYREERNRQLLRDFYSGFDELTGVFTFRGDDFMAKSSDYENVTISELSMFGSAGLTPDTKSIEDDQCVELDNIETSYLATCIQWKLCNDSVSSGDTTNITDCTLYRAIQETYEYYLNSSLPNNSSSLAPSSSASVDYTNVIAWSIPFACFGGHKICYVGLTKEKASPNEKEPMYVGALLSFHRVADTAEEILWEQSGISNITKTRESLQRTAYSDLGVQFSFYLFVQLGNLGWNGSNATSNSFFANEYDVSGDYLLAASENEVIETTQTSYGVQVSSIMLANESSNDVVRTTYNFLNATEQTTTKYKPTIARSSWGLPKIVYYRYDNSEGLNWVSVITVSDEVFVGDHDVYRTLGSISLGGWLIIYLFIHFISHRRFQENIKYWESMYQIQIEQEMFPILDSELLEQQDEENSGDDSQQQENTQEPQDEQKEDQQQQQQQQPQQVQDERLDEQLTLDFISTNIRDTVRQACQQDWIRQQDDIESDLPTKRKDITDHYHKRALRHIYQAKRGMNIITVVQMEQYGQSKAYRLLLYAFKSSPWWRYFMQALYFLHCLLVFWRPLTETELKDEGYAIVPQVLEWICLLFEFIDLVLSYFIQFKWQDTSKNPLISPSQQARIFYLRAFVWFLIFIDMNLIVWAEWSFTRIVPLRPILLLLSNDKLVGAAYALAITSINAADVLLLFVMLLGIAAVSGVILFRFEALMGYYNVYTFHNVIRSLFTTYVFVISGENFGELVYVSTDNSPAFVHVAFFISLTVLGSWIVVSLVVSRFQTSFKEIYNRERERRIYFKRTGYVAAFSLINLDDDNQVNKHEFESFVKFLKEETKRSREKDSRQKKKKNKHSDHMEVAEELLSGFDFESFDTDGDDSIDIREFVTKLEEIYQKPTLINIINDDDNLLAWIRLNIVETEAFSQFVLVVILIEFIVFSLFAIYPGNKSMEMLDIILAITVILNGMDIAVKIFSMGWDYYWNTSKCRIINRHKTQSKQAVLRQQEQMQMQRQSGKPTIALSAMGSNQADDDDDNSLGAVLNGHDDEDIGNLYSMNMSADPNDPSGNNARQEYEYEESVYTQDPLHLKQREFAHRADLLIVSAAMLLFIFSRIMVNRLWFTDNSNLYRLVMIIPLFRLFTLIKTTRSAVYIITKVIPRFASLVMILLMLFYFYAVLGVWLIGDDLQENLEDEPLYSFATFPKALITLFQLTVGEGWHDVMYTSVYAADSLLTTSWYFLSFILIITMIFTNLFVGLVISVVDDLEQENKNKYGLLQKEYEEKQLKMKMDKEEERKKQKQKQKQKEREKAAKEAENYNNANNQNGNANVELAGTQRSNTVAKFLQRHNSKKNNNANNTGLVNRTFSQRAP